LLNLEHDFSLSKEQWPQLCARIDDIIAGQLTLENQSSEIKKIAQHYAARLIVNRAESQDILQKKITDYQEVDVASLELVRPRSIGVEHVGLEAIKLLYLSGVRLRNCMLL
jgi:hypothetical protein